MGLQHEFATEPDRRDQQAEIQPVARRQGQRVAGNPARELAESDYGTRERHGTDQDADIGFDVMDRQLDTRELLGWIHEVDIADGNGCNTDEAVQDRDELGHLGHLHTRGRKQANAATDKQGNKQYRVLRCDDSEYGRNQRDRHTDDAVPVTAARGFLVGKTAKGQDKENGRDDVRHGYDSSVNHVALTS